MSLYLNQFTTCAHAKCILAGEHGVLRRYPALVLPIKKMLLHFYYVESNDELTISNISNHFKANEKATDALINKLLLDALKQSLVLLNNININKIMRNIVLKNGV